MSESDFDQYLAVTKAAYDQALTSKRTFAFTSVKEFRGRDGYGYSGNVTRNGKVVGEVVEEGNGGSPYLRLSREDTAAFIAEGATFYSEDTEGWNVEEGYCTILAFASDLNKKRTVCVSIDAHNLSDGTFMTLTGNNKDLAAAAAYLLKSDLADKNPLIWVKAESRFVPAKDLLA